MGPNSVPPQILRIALLTLAIVVLYLTARYFLTPATFGDYGFYRAKALEEISSAQAVYAGRKACEECHSEEVEKLAAAEHKSLACEACHGPGRAHADNPDINRLAVLTFSHCVRCHEADPARPAWHKQVNVKEHYVGDVCTDCHVPHQPNEVP